MKMKPAQSAASTGNFQFQEHNVEPASDKSDNRIRLAVGNDCRHLIQKTVSHQTAEDTGNTSDDDRRQPRHSGRERKRSSGNTENSKTDGIGKDVPVVSVFGFLEKFINERRCHADDKSGNNVSFVIDPVKRTAVNQNVAEHTSAESRRKSNDKNTDRVNSSFDAFEHSGKCESDNADKVEYRNERVKRSDVPFP